MDDRNNNKRGLEGEDDLVTAARSSLRARRDRLARRKAAIEAQKETYYTGHPVDSAGINTSIPSIVTTHAEPSETSSSKKNRLLANEYSQPAISTENDKIAMSLISSSKILSMDDSSLLSGRGRALSGSGDITPKQEDSDPPTPVEGESGAMSSLRRSLPASMRLRRVRREITADDLSSRTRTPSRELINSECGLSEGETIKQDLLNREKEPLINGFGSSSPLTTDRRNSLVDETDARFRQDKFSTDSGVKKSSDLTSHTYLTRSEVTTPDATLTESRRVEVDHTKPVTMSSMPEIVGETREERIARYKEMRKAALAARAAEIAGAAAIHDDETNYSGSGYVPRYLRRRESSENIANRSLNQDEPGSTFVSKYRSRRAHNEDLDVNRGLSRSSSAASSLNDLHVTRKDSSASDATQGSGETAPPKLTIENLKLHDKISGSQPYTSLSRLEEVPVKTNNSETFPMKDDEKLSSSPETTGRWRSHINNKPEQTEVSPNGSTAQNNQLNRQRRDMDKVLGNSTSNINGQHRLADSSSEWSPPTQDSVNSDMPSGHQLQRSDSRSSTLSDRLKKFQNAETSTPASKGLPSKPPGKLNVTRFEHPEDVLSRPVRSTVKVTPMMPAAVNNLVKRFASPDQETRPAAKPEHSQLPNPGRVESRGSNGDMPTLHTENKIESAGEVESTTEKPQIEDVSADAGLDLDPELSAVLRLRQTGTRITSVRRDRTVKPVSFVASEEEPLLDPQLAAMLDARKKKDTSMKESNSVTSMLKSRLQRREEANKESPVERSSMMSVTDRASYFKEEQTKQFAAAAVSKPLLDRHPSAKIPQVDRQDSEAHRAIGAKRAMLLKKRQRAQTQPITVVEVFAAKSKDKARTQDDINVCMQHPPRGRLFSLPQTDLEIKAVKSGSPPQKRVQPPVYKNESQGKRKSSANSKSVTKTTVKKQITNKSVAPVKPATGKVASNTAVASKKDSVDGKKTAIGTTPTSSKVDVTKKRPTSLSTHTPISQTRHNVRTPTSDSSIKTPTSAARKTSIDSKEKTTTRRVSSVKLTPDNSTTGRSLKVTTNSAKSQKPPSIISDTASEKSVETFRSTQIQQKKTNTAHIDKSTTGDVRTRNGRLSASSEDLQPSERTPSRSFSRTSVGRHSMSARRNVKSRTDSGLQNLNHPIIKRRSSLTKSADSPTRSKQKQSEDSDTSSKRASSTKRLNVKITDGIEVDCSQHLPPSTTETGSSDKQPEFARRHRDFSGRLSRCSCRSCRLRANGSTYESEDTPSYMRTTASAFMRDKSTPAVEGEEPVQPVANKRPTSNLRELDSGQLPSYMKATASFASRLESKLDDDEESEVPTASAAGKSKPIDLIQMQTGELPSFMKPTTSSTIKTEKELLEEEEKPKFRRAVSPTLPDGDLPSYMKATESYFKKADLPDVAEEVVEHLFDEGEPDIESKPVKKRVSITVSTASSEVPSFMKATKSFEAKEGTNQESAEVAENLLKSKKRQASICGDKPSFIKPTQSVREKTPDYNGLQTDQPEKRKFVGQSHDGEKKKSIVGMTDGELPSFMKPTKSFEHRDKHLDDEHVDDSQINGDALTYEKKPAVRKKMVVNDGDTPSYMKTTQSVIKKRETASEHGSMDSLASEDDKEKKTQKRSVTGFIRKKLGLNKGAQSSIESSTGSSARKTSIKSGDSPSYMKATSSSAQRKVDESNEDVTNPTNGMTSIQATNSHVMATKKVTPHIEVQQVSIDGEDHNVQMRRKKSSTGKQGAKSKEEPDSTGASPKTSLAQRLQSLQVNGEESWKRRVGQKDIGSIQGSNTGSIHDRLSLIKDDSEKWRKKKGIENDAKQFTVEGKIANKSTANIVPSPLLPRKERTPGGPKKANSLRLKREDEKEKPKVLSAQVTPRAKSQPVEQTIVKVPQMEEMAEFFRPTSTVDNIDVKQDDFDHMFVYSSEMLTPVQRIKPRRKQASKTVNPVKALQQRADLLQEYIEVRSDVAEKELSRMQKLKVADDAHRVALAGLATKENFKKVSLRKADADTVMTPGGSASVPYKDVMLLQIKGRRHVETRLVEPVAKSVNSGDCFLLVTKSRIYQWVGEFANVMERSKAADLATYIQAKKDLGCTGASNVIIIEETRQSGPYADEFWGHLGGSASYSGSGPVDEDELYEEYMAETNAVYRMEGDDLLAVDGYCGQIPKYSWLQDSELLVFDFGSEVYAWCGKQVPFDKRKGGLKLAQMLFDSGYDYQDCEINPLAPLCPLENGGLCKQGTRPTWCLCGKVTANMETVLFKEKFYDWPESSRLIQVKNDEVPTNSTLVELKAYDAKMMLEIPEKPVTLILEQSNVGRGRHWVEYEDGLRKEYQIDTVGIRMWHVSVNDYYELMEDDYGHFHAGDTYVVRWQYNIKQCGVRNLRGDISKHQSQMGRERSAYFFWQGDESSINEKGASALMTVELDEEHGPQVRVEQGLEPACFLSLFDGHMIIHSGKREDGEKRNAYKLYIVLHEHENETCLQEVPCKIESLRSSGTMILLNIKTGSLYVWLGCQTTDQLKSNGLRMAKWIAEKCPMEMGLSLESSVVVTEMHEGEENMEFKSALRSNNRQRYDCLLKCPIREQTVARMFHLSSVNMVFHAQEIFAPARNETYSPFPFGQSQLYNATQPALFLLDFGSDVYLWQGWSPLSYEDVENVNTGSAKERFTQERKLTLETALSYCKAKRGKKSSANVVYAGKEPLQFTNRFPYWTEHEMAKTSNHKTGKTALDDMQEVFDSLSRAEYSLDELRRHPLPDGVNPKKLETYLSDSDFKAVIKIGREEFDALPSWKQTKLRKEAGLF